MKPTAGDIIQRLRPADLHAWSDDGSDVAPVLAACVAAEWRTTKHGRHLLLIVCSLNVNDAPVVFFGPAATPFREYWTPKASAAILSRRFGSHDPVTWPDSFVLPLMIARNVKNPKTGERRDRVWVLPDDLWPVAVGGGATTGAGT